MFDLRRFTLVAAMAATTALVAASLAFAATTYIGPMYWTPTGIDGHSSYSNWQANDFSKSTSGVSDTVVTLIDNSSYSWHGTVRNMDSYQHAFWGYEGTDRKGYCKYYAGTNFNGSCYAYV